MNILWLTLFLFTHPIQVGAVAKVFPLMGDTPRNTCARTHTHTHTHTHISEIVWRSKANYSVLQNLRGGDVLLYTGDLWRLGCTWTVFIFILMYSLTVQICHKTHLILRWKRENNLEKSCLLSVKQIITLKKWQRHEEFKLDVCTRYVMFCLEIRVTLVGHASWQLRGCTAAESRCCHDMCIRITEQLTAKDLPLVSVSHSHCPHWLELSACYR